MKIETISAEWDCISDKSEVYQLLNMIHAMCGSSPSFYLKCTATYPDYVETVWTNNIVDVEAVTRKVNGEAISHSYSMKASSDNG